MSVSLARVAPLSSRPICLARDPLRAFIVALSCSVSVATLAQVDPTPGSFDATFASSGRNSNIALGSNDDIATAMALQSDGKIVMVGRCGNTTGDDFCAIRLLPTGAPDVSFKGPNAAGTGPNNANTSGRFLFRITASGNNQASAVAIQPDGKILVGGSCGLISQSVCIARLNADGSFDPTFDGPDSAGTGVGTGDGRFLFHPFSPAVGSFPLSHLNAIALQPDGKVIIAGDCNDFSVAGTNGARFCVARLNSVGSFDATFVGPSGVAGGRFAFAVNAATTNGESVRSIALQSDGRIVLAGSSGGAYAVARLQSNGQFDPTFASGNGRFAQTGNFGIGLASKVFVQPDGRLLLVGYSNINGDVINRNLITRLNADGSPDQTINVLGLPPGSLQTPPGNGYATARAAALQPDGKIIIGVDRFEQNLPGLYSGLERLHPTGDADTTFDGPPGSTPGDGWFKSALGPDVVAGAGEYYVEGVVDIALQPDGKIVTAGTCNINASAPYKYKFCVARRHGGPFSARRCSLDADGDGTFTATSDALILARVGVGLTDAGVVGNINFPVGSTRTTWPAIRDYLVTQCGMSIAP